MTFITLNALYLGPKSFADHETKFGRWQAVTVMDLLTEIGLFGLALYLVQGLNLPLKKRLIVMFAFSLRLPYVMPLNCHCWPLTSCSRVHKKENIVVYYKKLT